MAKASEQDRSREILEQGNIYFTYRPRVRPKAQANEQVKADDLGGRREFLYGPQA